MIADARYQHTNLVAEDWQALAKFYVELFGCEIVPPERDLSGAQFEGGVGVAGARVRGAHLRLPGWDAFGPTLEIFQYDQPASQSHRAVHRPGFAHIAFSVRSVAEARREVVAAGGTAVGEVVTTTISTGAKITWCYVRDPEENVIELQATELPAG